MGQDDIIWKPKGLATTVGFHRDSEYINSNFHGDGCTLWVGLDGGSERNGGVCYAVGSQNWEIEGGEGILSLELEIRRTDFH